MSHLTEDEILALAPLLAEAERAFSVVALAHTYTKSSRVLSRMRRAAPHLSELQYYLSTAVDDRERWRQVLEQSRAALPAHERDAAVIVDELMTKLEGRVRIVAWKHLTKLKEIADGLQTAREHSDAYERRRDRVHNHPLTEEEKRAEMWRKFEAGRANAQRRR